MTQPFAKTIAELAEQQMPDRVVSAMAKTLRRGKVLIDWSQNSDFKTTVCVYAMRAKEGGPFISMPVAWEELAKAVKTQETRGAILHARGRGEADQTARRLVRAGAETSADIARGFYQGARRRPAAEALVVAAQPQQVRPGSRQEPARIRGEAGSHQDAGARRKASREDGDGQGRPPLRHSETRGESPALRLAAGDAGRAALVGSARKGRR